MQSLHIEFYKKNVSSDRPSILQVFMLTVINHSKRLDKKIMLERNCYHMRLFHELSSLVGKYRTVQQQITHELHIFTMIVIRPLKAILCITRSKRAKLNV